MQSRLDFMEFDKRQRSILSRMQRRVAASIDKALDRFYRKVEATPETAEFFSSASHMRTAKSAQAKHWERLASGTFDDHYYDSVRRIGSVHARIGLEPRLYIGAYGLVLENLIRDIGGGPAWLPAFLRRSRKSDAVVALVKAALLDMEMSVSVYFEEAQADREAAVSALADGLSALAQGDLTRAVNGLPESFAELEASYNRALEQLRDLVGSVAEGTTSIRGSAGEIMQASEDLARRTEANAASLEQTAASLVEVEGRVKASATAARNTVERANEATESVASGRQVTGDAVQAMERVSENAQAIDAVIEGLDKIAFQTRVLAMNAAVEAGRAGEAGRGFAVVADLVSALAMRAEEEAQSARAQLTLTQTGIGTAVDAVQKVDGALSQISTGVSAVHELLGSMAKDNEAQSSALTQVSSAIGEMDKSTQQNAAMVEETSAAARSLSSEVNELASQAARFDLGLSRSDVSSTPRTAALPAPSTPATRAVPAGPALAHAAASQPAGEWTAF
ncbi:chemotaxis protein [Pacificimonas flava]|uniref:Chemotaxis protein n=1 Tax=Pacificimonas flava TaxID=1234595 RepID=A0A219B8J2_9SPHN|nr:chemotaxis protein [Pacificimonas flava]